MLHAFTHLSASALIDPLKQTTSLFTLPSFTSPPRSIFIKYKYTWVERVMHRACFCCDHWPSADTNTPHIHPPTHLAAYTPYPHPCPLPGNAANAALSWLWEQVDAKPYCSELKCASNVSTLLTAVSFCNDTPPSLRNINQCYWCIDPHPRSLPFIRQSPMPTGGHSGPLDLPSHFKRQRRRIGNPSHDRRCIAQRQYGGHPEQTSRRVPVRARLCWLGRLRILAVQVSTQGPF